MLILIVIETVEIISQGNELSGVILIFYCILSLVHSFIFLILKDIYDFIKEGLRCEKSTCSTFYPGYYKTIERNRINLNGGYEIPKISEHNRSSNYYESKFTPSAPSEKTVYEMPGNKDDRISYAEIHPIPPNPKTPKKSNYSNTYDELRKPSADPNDYSKLTQMR